MPQFINSNISSLTAQRNLNTSQNDLNTSLQRLSSGLRINSAKDDAAGLAISERFTSQIRGLNQAIRNANDGVSLAQTAEGALGANSGSLQRIRELAIQSANSTNSASDRKALNNEAAQLLAEVQRVGETTQFNGQNILDGTFTSAQFQVGANANQTISFGIAGATTNLLGAYQQTGTPVGTNALASGDVTINGITVGVSVATSAAGVDDDSATAKATAINAVTSETGVTATASNTVSGGALTARTGLANGALIINGISIGAVASSTSVLTQGQNAATAINAVTTQTGVTAVADAGSGRLTLSTTDGRNVSITSNPATAAGSQDILNATGLDASTAGNATGNEARTLTITAAAVANDTITIDGQIFEFVTTTGDSITAGNTEIVLTGATATTTGSDIRGAIQAAYTAGTSSVVATGATTAVILTSDQVGTLTTVASETGTIAFTDGGAAGGTAGADGTGVTNFGSLTLSSSENFTLGGNTLGNAGLSGGSSSLTLLSSVDISTVAGSNAAISILDGALSQVSTIRSGLGAVQNRFDSTIANLATTSENLSAARSRIQDADFAAETAALTRAQILQQAGTSILAQANQLPQNVLSLLQ